MERLIAIALSGGIDSLVAAYLLKEQGHNVIGIHFITGYEIQPPDDAGNLSTPKSQASRIISHIANQLDIKVKLIDCSIEFKKEVVDYFVQTYQTGKTPNPCIVCNPVIKFGAVLSFARKLGASTLATGHYARITKDSKNRFHLLKGFDPKKDQSYFLAFMTQQHLSSACFPLESMTKSEVLKLANEKGLDPFLNRESNDVCFIRNKTYGKFLALQEGFEPKPGLIEDVNGNVLGEHNGLHLFTIGQRRGINCPASEPYYVVSMDTEQNRLKVGFKKDLVSSECRVKNINWINQKPSSPINVHTRVRYRHKAAASKLFLDNEETAIVRFEQPQSAITPGQCSVFYRDDEVLGGGWISN